MKYIDKDRHRVAQSEDLALTQMERHSSVAEGEYASHRGRVYPYQAFFSSLLSCMASGASKSSGGMIPNELSGSVSVCTSVNLAL